MFGKILRQTTDFVSEHNRITLLVMLLLTGVVTAGIVQLDFGSQVDSDTGQFDDLDRVQKADYIQAQYGNVSEANRSVEPLYVWEENGNVLSKESLLAGLRYQQEIRDNDTVQSVLHQDGISGLENLVATRVAGDQSATIDEQIRALEETSPTEIERVVGQLVNEGTAQQFLPADHDGSVSSSDRRTFITLDASDMDALEDADTVLYDTANEYSESGFFVVTSETFTALTQNFNTQLIELVLPIALLLILSILVFTYRDVVDVVVGMSGVVLSILWMLGIMGWLDVQASTIIVVPIVLITGLSIDFGFHVFNRYREERGPDENIQAPMGRGIRYVSTALILVMITASIGFLSNLTNPLQVIQDLGVSITLGVISALIIFVAFVPALKVSIDGLLERIGLDRRKAPLGRGSVLKPALESSVALAKRAAPVVLVVAVLVGSLGAFAWTELDQEDFQGGVNDDVAEWKKQLPDPVGWEESEASAEIDRPEIYQPGTAAQATYSRILVEDDVTADSTLEDIESGVSEIDDEGLLVKQSGIQNEQSPTTAMARVAEENERFAAIFTQADTNGNGIPDQNLEAVYDAFYAADSQAANEVLERSDGEYRTALVTLALDFDGANRADVVSTLDDAAETMEGETQRTATAAGSSAVNSAILDSIIDGVVLTMIVALAAVTVTLVVIFRVMHGSASLGAVTALPIALVLGLVIGGMLLLGIPLTLLTALLMSLVIGLGIDYNIHIGDRYADELADGKSPTESLRLAVTGTGGALLGSTLTSTSAFGTIAVVPSPQLQSFGYIAVIALLASFVVSIVVLPSMLLLWSRYDLGTVSVRPSSDEPMAQD